MRHQHRSVDQPGDSAESNGLTTWMIEFLVLAGVMVPPAVVPTIWLLQGLKLFGTLHGMILIEVAYNLPFSIILYRAFVATIPSDLRFIRT